MDEVDVQPVDLGDEVRQGGQLGLAPAPVVLLRPVTRHLADHRLLHARRRSVTSSRSGQWMAARRAQRLQLRLGVTGTVNGRAAVVTDHFSVVTDMWNSLVGLVVVLDVR